jgi:hypothetical protein
MRLRSIYFHSILVHFFYPERHEVNTGTEFVKRIIFKKNENQLEILILTLFREEFLAHVRTPLAAVVAAECNHQTTQLTLHLVQGLGHTPAQPNQLINEEAANCLSWSNANTNA